MGEAKRRAVAYEAAKAKLIQSVTGDTRVVAEAAIKLFEGFMLPQRYTGGCYLTTMILSRFLKQECRIEAEAVVGYINDGTDDIFISHSWLEHAGSKTDLTINLTEMPEFRGPLLVQDQTLRPGNVTYTYHRERTPEALAADMEMLADPRTTRIARHKAEEHQAMLARASNPSLMDAYINMAPKDQGYEAMAEVLRR
jgi:hypothetical protein